MQISYFNTNNANQCSFKGKLPNADDLMASRRFVNRTLGGLWDELSASIKKKQPDIFQNINGVEYIPDDGSLKKVITGFKSFFGMPLDFVDSIAKKFPNSSLNNAEFLQKHRENVQLEENIRAMQGLQKNGSKFAKEYMDANGLKDYPIDRKINDSVSKKFLEQLNDIMKEDIANYDTKKERFTTRLISGFTAAFFLGNDFFNNAIQKGKTEKEAQKEQKLKQGQEIKENICEAITQFAVFACFSKTINKSPWAPAIIGAGIGLVSRVISRLTSGMKITRMKAPKQNQLSNITLDEFANCAKTQNFEELNNKKEETDDSKEHKKPLLSLKNILLFCAASILGGYALRFGKNHTKIGQNIAEIFKKRSEKLKPKIIEEVFTTPDELMKMADSMPQKKFAKTIGDITNNINDTDKIFLGTQFKTKKFGKLEIKVKDLKDLKWAPFKFVKELVSYPYKIAAKLEEAIRNSMIIKNGGTIPKKPEPLQDKYKIMNLYKTFQEFEKKFGTDEEKLTKEFGDYVNKMILKANNEVTSSKGDNSKIAVLAQTLGTLTGIWFNMNDEFNASVRNGSTKSEAQKDARLRGINKFFRMTVQVIIAGSLNNIFKKYYNNSIAASAIVVAASTILTDMASRILSAMPSKKMTKEELDKYQKDHKEGIMRWYYNAIDKLAS